jgi:hypothetical protein
MWLAKTVRITIGRGLRGCPQAQFISHKNIKTYLSRPKKGTFGGLPGVALSIGRDIAGHRKKHSFEHSFSPAIQLTPPPCWLSCWLSCWLLCCCHVVVVVFAYFVAALPTPPLPPPSARCRHRHRRHHRQLARRMTPATGMPTAAPPRRHKLSAGRWNPAHCWTSPS